MVPVDVAPVRLVLVFAIGVLVAGALLALVPAMLAARTRPAGGAARGVIDAGGKQFGPSSDGEHVRVLDLDWRTRRRSAEVVVEPRLSSDHQPG